MKRATHRALLPLFIAIALFATFASSRREWAEAAPNQPSSPEPTRNPEQWREDLRYLSQELPRRHVNAFHNISAEVWADEVAALDEAIPTFADHVILIRMTRLVALVGDAHTSLGWTSQRYPLRSYPIFLSNRPDGLFVIAVASQRRETSRGYADNSRALGARVVSIGGIDIELVKQRVTTLISTDNEVWPTFVLPNFLNVPEVLNALEVVPDMDHGQFVVEDAEGRRMELDLAPVSQSELTQLPLLNWPGVRRWTRPLIFTRPNSLNYWYEYLEGQRTVYFRYRRCQEMASQPFAGFSQELLSVLDTRDVDRLIIELRDNTGGNSAILDPFIEAIRSRPRFNQTGKLFVLINRGTFSSGMLNANTLQLRTRAILIGEPTGGKPNSYGEVRNFTLPHSGLTVNYSTRFFRLRADDPPALMPDVLVEYPWSAFEAGRDPVLEAALNY
ncbi:MAG: S41 family peptidase [Blastocatellia bacterium]